MPALGGPSDAPPQRDPLAVQVQVLGVEVGGTQVVAFARRPPAGQAAETGPCETGQGKAVIRVVLLLGLQVIAMAIRHESKITTGTRRIACWTAQSAAHHEPGRAP